MPPSSPSCAPKRSLKELPAVPYFDSLSWFQCAACSKWRLADFAQNYFVPRDDSATSPRWRCENTFWSDQYQVWCDTCLVSEDGPVTCINPNPLAKNVVAANERLSDEKLVGAMGKEQQQDVGAAFPNTRVRGGGGAPPFLAGEGRQALALPQQQPQQPSMVCDDLAFRQFLSLQQSATLDFTPGLQIGHLPFTVPAPPPPQLAAAAAVGSQPQLRRNSQRRNGSAHPSASPSPPGRESDADYDEVSLTAAASAAPHSDGHRAHSCSECGRDFATKGTLKLHMRIHTGDKPFQCPGCLTRYAQLANCSRHIRLVHKDDPELHEELRVMRRNAKEEERQAKLARKTFRREAVAAAEQAPLRDYESAPVPPPVLLLPIPPSPSPLIPMPPPSSSAPPAAASWLSRTMM